MLRYRQEELKDEIEAAFAKTVYKNHIATNGLKAYLDRIAFLRKMQPMRDLDIVKINELHSHITNKLDVDIETIGDFTIDQAQFLGFDEAQHCLREVLKKQIKFYPISRANIQSVRDTFMSSKIIDLSDAQLLTDAGRIFPDLKEAKMIFRHSDNFTQHPKTKVVSSTTSP